MANKKEKEKQISNREVQQKRYAEAAKKQISKEKVMEDTQSKFRRKSLRQGMEKGDRKKFKNN